jgi:uncharacterized protein YndB with AHSA1/START domain
MDPVHHDILIDQPRDEVFAYLSDVSRWPEFTDHFLVGWHLTREDTIGQGVGARCRTRGGRTQRFSYHDLTFAEVIPPRRILARGRGGKFNRTRAVIIVDLEPEAGGTRVNVSVETDPGLVTDKLMEIATRARARTGRKWAKALRRLRSILEEGEDRGRPATISGGARKPATGTPLR